MQNYGEFLDHSVGFPQAGFQVIDEELFFHNINLMELVETYDTPLRFTYTPIISEKIKQAKRWFEKAIKKRNYKGTYTYCYCTKSSHFKHILEEVLKNDIHLETSSAYDMPVIKNLQKRGLVDKNVAVICNGFKTELYKQHIVDMMHSDFTNIIPILDSKEELNFYEDEIDFPIELGLRVSTEEKPDSQFYTSRLGIRQDDIIELYNSKLAGKENFKVTILHFFVSAGISDTPYYWNELEKYVHLYCKFKKVNPDLHTLNIGGGLPFKDSLVYDFDYEYMIEEIVGRIKDICKEHNLEEPNLITEFGKYTVAEASGSIFKVLGRKQQNDREKWLMLDGSFITTLPDVWAINQRYILLPINNWDCEYEPVILGGITCDSQDFYSQETHMNNIYMPKTRKLQYIGFFNTGAYQEVLSGYGGIHHCLMPSPKHVIIKSNSDNSLKYEVFGEEQNSKQMIKLLGYS